MNEVGWFTEVTKTVGPIMAVLLLFGLGVITYLVKALSAEQARHKAERDAHDETRDKHAAKLEEINGKTTAALVASATATAQFTEVLRTKGSRDDGR